MKTKIEIQIEIISLRKTLKALKLEIGKGIYRNQFAFSDLNRLTNKIVELNLILNKAI